MNSNGISKRKTCLGAVLAAVLALGGMTSARANNWSWSSEKNKQITDGNWVLTLQATTIGEESGWNVYSVVTTSTVTDTDGDVVLDLRGEIPAKPILSIRNGIFINKAGKVYLPDTIRSVDGFGDSKGMYGKLKKVMPFFGSNVTTVNQFAFQNNTNLVGDVVLENVSSMGQKVFQNCKKITSAVLGKNITELKASVFNGCEALTNVVVNGKLTSIGDNYVFSGVPATLLTDVMFAYAPPYTEYAGGRSSYTIRMRIPETELANLSTGRTLWENLPDSYKAEYTSRFGTAETPYALIGTLKKDGSWTVGRPNKQWLFLYKQEVTSSQLQIQSGSGVDGNIGVPTPNYGTQIDIDKAVACSVPQYAKNVKDNSDQSVIFESYASTLQQLQTDNTWTASVTNMGRAYTFEPQTPGTYRLTWLWRRAGCVPKIQNPTVAGTHVVTQLTTPTLMDGYLFGDAVRYSVEAQNGGTFKGWYGDVPEEQRMNKTVEVVAKDGLTLKPFVSSPKWVLTKSADGKYTYAADGGWYIPVTGAPEAIVLGTMGGWTGITAAPDYSLDLTKPVQGGGTFVGFVQQWGRGTTVKKLILPKTIRNIPNMCFYENPIAGEINLLGVTNVSGKAFAYCTGVSALRFGPMPTIDSTACTGWTAGQSVWTVPDSDPGWSSFFTNATQFTCWKDLTDAQKATWTGAGHPYGRTVGYGKQWVVLRASMGLSVIIK